VADQQGGNAGLAFSSSIKSTIFDWMASSPVVGLSAISSEGSDDSAIAIIARWHMPL
jgi:hypothetical protein